MTSLQSAADLHSPRGEWSPGRPDRRSLPADGARATALPWPARAFILSLALPWMFPLGDLRFSVYRIVLMLALLPCLLLWARGGAGRLRLADFGLFAFCLWVALSLAVVHGPGAAVQPAGIWFIETMGAYLLARCYIRDANDFRNMVTLFVKLIVFLLPFAAYEWVTGNNLLLGLCRLILPTYDVVTMPPRMGVWRVQGPFVHPILFGIFCSTMLSLTWLVDGHGRSMAGRIFLTCVVAGMAVFSMSSAPIAGLAAQIVLMVWNRALLPISARWKLLWALIAAMYLVIEIGSTHTPVQYFISHFTFDQQTGWYRLAIWEAGTASVLNHPVFGIGLGDWVRPDWMGGDSVDDFWLLMAMRHGLPAFCLLVGSCLTIWLAIARRRDLDAETDRARTAYLICMAAYVFVGSTVHLWDSSYVAFIFLIGAGVWLLDAEPGRPASARPPRTYRQHALEQKSAGSRADRQETTPIVREHRWQRRPAGVSRRWRGRPPAS